MDQICLSTRTCYPKLSVEKRSLSDSLLGLNFEFIGWLIGGLVIGFLLGWVLGLNGVFLTLTCALIVIPIGRISGLSEGLLIWLSGWLGVSLGIGLIGFVRRGPDHSFEYGNRVFWFWWRNQPNPDEIETALRQMCSMQTDAKKLQWDKALHNLDKRQKALNSDYKKKSDEAPMSKINQEQSSIFQRIAHWFGRPFPPSALVEDQNLNSNQSLHELAYELQSDDWITRFVARHLLTKLAANAGEVIESLLVIAKDQHSPAQRTAIRLLQLIGQETTAQFGQSASRLLCPKCLVRCNIHQCRLSAYKSVSYYGCRDCGQSRDWLSWSGKVVIVFDIEWAEEITQQNDIMRVNGLVYTSLFDFDWVEIVQATDEVVERFAVKVGNDTDIFRQPRYRAMQCIINPNSGLSENTVRILGSLFGKIGFQQIGNTKS